MADAPVSRRAIRHEPVVLLTTALAAFLSVSRASALALTELGVGLFVVMGVAGGRTGAWALPAIVAATLLAVYVRHLDVASWGLLLPGGLPGRVERAFGRRGHRIGAAATLAERLLLAAFASVIVGDHFAHLLTAAVGLDVLGHEVTTTELAAVLAVASIAILWMRMRLGHLLPVRLVARGVWLGVSVLGVILALATWSLWRAGGDRVAGAVTLAWPPGSHPIWDGVMVALLAFGLALPTVGGGDALTRLAHEFPAPRLGVLRRTARIVMSLVAAGTVLLTIAFLVLVPADSRAGWAELPLAGLIRHLSTAGWVRGVLQVGLSVTTMLFLVPAIQACMVDAGQLLRRLAAAGVLPEALAMPHPRLGTLTKSLDVVTAASVLLVLTSAGRVAWLAGAYATAIAATVALRAVAIARLRQTGVDGLPAPGPAVAVSGRRGAVGPAIVALAMAVVTAFMLGRGDGAWLAAAALMLGLTLLLSRQARRTEDESLGEAEGFELLASSAIAVEDAQAQPGNILVAVRHPHALEHVAAALQGGADREVVVMTVRLHGVDTDSAGPDDPDAAAGGALPVLARDHPRRALRTARSPAGGSRGHRGRRPGDGGGPPAVVRGLRRRIRDALVGRPVAAPRRGLGAYPRNQSPWTSGSSSITAADVPTPITSGRICRRSRPETSTSFTACGAKPHSASGPTSTTTTSSGRRSRTWKHN